MSLQNWLSRIGFAFQVKVIPEDEIFSEKFQVRRGLCACNTTAWWVCAMKVYVKTCLNAYGASWAIVIEIWRGSIISSHIFPFILKEPSSARFAP